jgi:hypothetical protein
VFSYVRQQKQNYDKHPDYFQRKQGEGQKDHLLEIFQRQDREQGGADDQYDFIRFHGKGLRHEHFILFCPYSQAIY